ncbi:MAG: allophanate hydrolase [Gammaproteobacteria bacterium BRH_c0]|nr:MAG: allophanate hydrolase [Gammaproteobacteria bacterium BRH_c0]
MIPDLSTLSLTIASLHQHYRSGDFTPAELAAALRNKAADYSDRNIWIHLLSAEEQAPWLAALVGKSPDDLPLFGIPFVIKDNIDLAGIPTTAACVEFSHIPENSAFVVELLIKAGAIPVGKANLDQFATGLNGTRSPEPWGPCRNGFNSDYISGGSSSGSAVSVALGLASFSLGTDTAGSGRVPASFNNLVGLKPSLGALSSTGMIPACRTLDTISIFALTASDAEAVLDVAAVYDRSDGYARSLTDTRWPQLAATGSFSVAIPPQSQLEFFGNDDAAALFNEAVQRMKSIGATVVEKDFSGFFAAASLLYHGPWVAERFVAIEQLVSEKPQALHPAIRAIVEPAGNISAVDTFKAEYQMAQYRRFADEFFADVDFALTPTAGTIYTVEELLNDPIQLNTNLGYYTNFMNLLNCAAVALPVGFLGNGLPWGVTAFTPAGGDRALLRLAVQYLSDNALPLGATGLERSEETFSQAPSPDWIDVVVCGAHLSGYPLNHQLTSRGARLKAATRSSPHYKFYALAGGPPFRPGMVRVEEGGAAIEVEVWAVPADKFGSFVAGIPAPLGIGKVELADGSWVPGFICEPCGIEGARDITELGSWRKVTT